jgi:hypothetical protein
VKPAATPTAVMVAVECLNLPGRSSEQQTKCGNKQQASTFHGSGSWFSTTPFSTLLIISTSQRGSKRSRCPHGFVSFAQQKSRRRIASGLVMV